MCAKYEEKMMSGNEAFARGALETGIGFCASYPGTPSSEITSTLKGYAQKYDLHVEWSTNEKVALEACAGASWAGVPAVCPMKSLGLNVASDFLLNVNLSGTGSGGLVIVVCDDPRGHSSSNEQDSRFYAKASYLPLLEPSTCQQAKDIMPYAFEVSRKYEIPVLVRSTTRLSHSRAIVELGEISERKWSVVDSFPDTLFNVPNPHQKHRELDEKLSNVHREFEQTHLNSVMTSTDADTVMIASGICHRYAQEALTLSGATSVDIVNLVTTYPIPQKPMHKWLLKKENVLFVEEVDPFIEEEILALTAELERKPRSFRGKRDGTIPFYGELNTDIVSNAIESVIGEKTIETPEISESIKIAKSLLIPRPLTFCAGCTHRNVYWAIRKVRQRLKDKLVVAGDIGCYSLGVFYDHSMDTMQAMGSGIGTACGLGQLHRFGFEHKVIAVAGDSTFFHACIPGLVNARHKNADITFIILDNATTAMTGFQSHPGSKRQEEHRIKRRPVSIERIVKAVEPDFIERSDSRFIPKVIDLIWDTIHEPGFKVLIFDGVCRLEEGKRIGYKTLPKVIVIPDKCKGESCRICVGQFGCPALEWDVENELPMIIDHACVRCQACVTVCPHDALRRE